MKCCKQEGVCPYCGIRNYTKDVNVVSLELSMYKIVRCGKCDNKFAVPYLLVFDENRPEDEMEVDL